MPPVTDTGHFSRRGASLSFGVAMAAIGLIWLGVRFVYFNGYYTEDSPGYVSDAVAAALGTYHARDHVNGLNVGTYLPVALPVALLGKSEIALGLWPLFCSLLGLLSLAGASAIAFGPRWALLAGLLYATYPGDVFFSTVVMPDAIQAGWLAFAVFLVVSACVRPVFDRRWGLAAAGVAIGACHLIRANGPLLAPVGAAAILALGWRSHRGSLGAAVRDVSTYLAGWLAVHVVEGLVYLWAAGDFLHRFHVVNRHYGTIESIGRWGLNTAWHTIPFSIFPPWLWWRVGAWGGLNQDQAYHGFLFSFALAGILLAALALAARTEMPAQTRAGFTLGVFWFAWPLLYHQFGSQSLTHFVPMHRLSRHLVVYAPGAMFATVAACAVLAAVISRWRLAPARRAIAAAGLLLLVLHLALNWEGERIAYRAYHRIKDTYVRIRERLPVDVQTIVADPGDLGVFDFWLNPLGAERVRLVPFANYARCDELTSGVVFTWSNPGWEALAAPVIQETVERLPCLTHPPPGWRLLYEGFPEKIFVIGRPAMR